MSLKRSRKRPKTISEERLELLVEEVIDNIPTVLVAIVFSYARPVVERSSRQKSSVRLCCASADAKQIYSIKYGEAVQCFDTLSWTRLHQHCCNEDISSRGTIFRNKLWLLNQREPQTLMAFSLQCRPDAESYRIDGEYEKGLMIEVIAYKRKNVLIGVRREGQLQWLDVDHDQYRVVEIKTSQFFQSFGINAIALNEGASEIYIATGPVVRRKRTIGQEVIRVVDADTLVQKRVVTCGARVKSVYGLTYSHTTNSLFVSVAYCEPVSQKEEDGGEMPECSRIMTVTHPNQEQCSMLDLADHPGCAFSELIAVDHPTSPSLLTFDSFNLTFMRIFIPF